MEQTPANVTAGAVRAEMARNRVSIRDLAEATGIAKTTLARRINGQYPFGIDQLVAIAQHLEVPLTVLLPTDTTASAA